MKKISQLIFFVTFTYSFQRYNSSHLMDFSQDYLNFIELNKQNINEFATLIKEEIKKLNSKNDIGRSQFIEQIDSIIKNIDIKTRKEYIKTDMSMFLVKHLSIYPIDQFVNLEYSYLIKEYLKPVTLLTENYEYIKFNTSLTVDKIKTLMEQYIITLDKSKIDLCIFFSKIKYYYSNKKKYIEKGKPLDTIDYLYGSILTSRNELTDIIKKRLMEDVLQKFPEYFTCYFIKYNLGCSIYENFKATIKNEAVLLFNKIADEWKFVERNDDENENNLVLQKNDILQFFNSINMEENFSDVSNNIEFIFTRLSSYYDSRVIRDLIDMHKMFMSRLWHMQNNLQNSLESLHFALINEPYMIDYNNKKYNTIFKMKKVLDTFMLNYNEILTIYDTNFYQTFIFICVKPTSVVIMPKPEQFNELNKIRVIQDINDKISTIITQINQYFQCFTTISLSLKQMINQNTIEQPVLSTQNKILKNYNIRKTMIIFSCEINLLCQMGLPTDYIITQIDKLLTEIGEKWHNNYVAEFEANLGCLNDENIRDLLTKSHKNFVEIIGMVENTREYLKSIYNNALQPNFIFPLEHQNLFSDLEPSENIQTQTKKHNEELLLDIKGISEIEFNQEEFDKIVKSLQAETELNFVVGEEME